MKSKNTAYYINVSVGLAFMLFFRFLPPLTPITGVGMAIIGIFIGLIYLWITVDSIWPSALALLLVAFSGLIEAEGYAAVTSVFSTAFGNSTVLMTLMYMMLFGAVGEIGLAEKFAATLLNQKFIEGWPYLLLFMLVFCCYLLAAMSEVMICLFIMWPVVVAICEKCGAKPGEKLWYTMMCSVFMGAVVGQPVLPFQGMVASLLATIDNVLPDCHVSMGVYLPFNFIMAVILLTCYTFLIRFVIRPDFTPLKSLKREDIMAGEVEKMTPVQVLFAVMLLILILTVVLPTFFPVFSFLGDIGVIGMLAILFAVAMSPRNKDVSRMVDLQNFARKTVSWNMIFMVTAAIYMSNILTVDAVGLKAALVGLLGPTLGQMATPVFVVLLITVAVFLTNAANNQVLGVILITLLGTFRDAMPGLNVQAAAVMVILSVVLAFLLPSGSIFTSVLHARKDLVSFKEIATIFIPVGIMAVIVYCVIGYPLAMLMFR